MFTHKHYVPILKTKAGERWALGHVFQQTRRNFTPLLELHLHKKKSNEDHVEEICDDLASFWGTSDRFFLDTKWLHEATGDAAVIASTFDAARDKGLLAVPVAQVQFDNQSIGALQAVVAADGRGYMLRITRDALLNPAAINAFTIAVGQPLANVDLMIDYQDDGSQLTVDLPHVPFVHDWRTITAASGIFPSAYAHLTLGAWHRIQRTDFQSWKAAIVGGGIPRKVAFADYTVRDPGPPADFGEASVNFRYTSQDYWLMRVGGKVKNGQSADSHAICHSLITQPEYCGPNYSSGDYQIQIVAGGPPAGPGNPQQWIQWCVNHHIEFVSRQIFNDPAI